MTESQIWRLDGHEARLQAPDLQLAIDLDQPSRGLADICAGNHLLPDATLMALRIPGLEGQLVSSSISEAYVRGSDLVVSYAIVAPLQLSSQVYWRYRQAGEAVGVEVLISMQTDLLESRPIVESVSSVRQAALWHGDVELGRFNQVQSAGRAVFSGDRTAPMFLYRIEGASHDYLEMAYPSDLDEFWGHVQETNAESGFRLLHEHLEKGVIRRLRIAGWFIPRSDHAPTAFELYARMLQADPPLTT